VERSSYFSAKHTPIREVGQELFNEWSQDEWACFDNYMMNCISIYLDMGLIDMPLKNLDYRKLIDIIGQEMNIFFGGLKKNEHLSIKMTYDDLMDGFPELRKRNISQNLVTRNLKKYCEYHSFELETAYSGGVGKFIINAPEEEPEEEPEDDFTPIKHVPF
jgi:hypothetical protein